MKTPLAWLNLLHDKARTMVAIAGVAFAVVLILMQLGFFGSVRQTATQVYDKLNFDLVIVSRQYLHITKPGVLPRTRLYQAMSVPGVARASPLYLGFNLWRHAQTRQRRGIFVMGFRLKDRLFDLPELEDQWSALGKPGNVFIDTRSRSDFGPTDMNTQTEVGRQRVTVAGKFAIGTGFGADGAIMVSEPTFGRLFPNRSPEDVSLGLVQIERGADLEEVERRMEEMLPEDVVVYSRAGIAQHELTHWVEKTSVGYIFRLGVVVGFVVGTAIVYQVLASDIANHLPEYATLKAMGYGRGYLTGVVLKQALLLAVAGYLPGLALSLGLYRVTSQYANIPLDMDPGRAVLMLVMSVVMCSLSGVAALRKVNSADPADLF